MSANGIDWDPATTPELTVTLRRDAKGELGYFVAVEGKLTGEELINCLKELVSQFETELPEILMSKIEPVSMLDQLQRRSMEKLKDRMIYECLSAFDMYQPQKKKEEANGSG